MAHDLCYTRRLCRRAVKQHGIRRTVDEDAARTAARAFLLRIRPVRRASQRELRRTRDVSGVGMAHGVDVHAPEAVCPRGRRHEVRRALLDEHEPLRSSDHAQEFRRLLYHMERHRPRNAVIEHDVLVARTRQRHEHGAHIALDDLHLDGCGLHAACQKAPEQYRAEHYPPYPLCPVDRHRLPPFLFSFTHLVLTRLYPVILSGSFSIRME